MRVRVVVTGGDEHRWRAAMAEALPEARFEHDGDDVDYLVAWRPGPDLFERLRVRKAIFNLGAGVDAMLSVATLPAGVHVYRLVDAGMAEQMCEYAVATVLRAFRDLDAYASAQSRTQWAPRERRDKRTFGVTVLGLGVLGRAVVDALTPFGFPLAGYARTPCVIPGVEVHAGRDGLRACLAGAMVCICLLPSTAGTRDFFDAERLSWLPHGAHLVNLARGDLVVDRDLIAALDRGHLAGATLDVFREEPLPASHAFWHHPKVTITPHVAAVTRIDESVRQVAAGIRRIEAGDEPPGRVDRAHGY
jgi:glyoxylate/hydroxypyruvate reductase A